jgi:hypothetical protein
MNWQEEMINRINEYERNANTPEELGRGYLTEMLPPGEMEIVMELINDSNSAVPILTATDAFEKWQGLSEEGKKLLNTYTLGEKDVNAKGFGWHIGAPLGIPLTN